MPKRVLTTSALRKLRRRSHPRGTGQEVHFHQGPQGQATPCYDDRCPNPRLAIKA